MISYVFSFSFIITCNPNLLIVIEWLWRFKHIFIFCHTFNCWSHIYFLVWLITLRNISYNITIFFNIYVVFVIFIQKVSYRLVIWYVNFRIYIYVSADVILLGGEIDCWRSIFDFLDWSILDSCNLFILHQFGVLFNLWNWKTFWIWNMLILFLSRFLSWNLSFFSFFFN